MYVLECTWLSRGTRIISHFMENKDFWRDSKGPSNLRRALDRNLFLALNTEKVYSSETLVNFYQTIQFLHPTHTASSRMRVYE